MKKVCGIYKITSPTGRIYIGQSTHIYRRWNYNYKRCDCKTQPILFNSLLRYGYEKHVFEIIETCSESELTELEIKYIKHFNTFDSDHGMNLSVGGERQTFSKESRMKMRAARLGKKMSDKSQAKRSKTYSDNFKAGLIVKPIRYNNGMTDEQRKERRANYIKSYWYSEGRKCECGKLIGNRYNKCKSCVKKISPTLAV